MRATQRKRNLLAATLATHKRATRAQFEPRTAFGVNRDIFGPHGAIGSPCAQRGIRLAERGKRTNIHAALKKARMLCHKRRFIAAGIQKRPAALGQRIEQLRFRERDVVTRFQIFQVRRSHDGHDAQARLRHGGKVRDLARAIHAHLDDEHLGRRGRRKHRIGGAEFVVEVALRRPGFIFRRKDVAHEAFGGGLPHRAGDANHRGGKRCAPCSGDFGNRFRHIGNHEHASAGGTGRFKRRIVKLARAQHRHGARINRGSRECMSVDALANDGRIHEARFHLTRVPRKAQGRDIATHGLHEHASIACLNYTSYFEFHSIHLNGIA